MPEHKGFWYPAYRLVLRVLYSYSTVPLARPSRPSVERPAVARTMDTDTRVGCTYTRVAAQLCTATQTAAYNAWVQQCQAHTHRQRDPAERQ